MAERHLSSCIVFDLNCLFFFLVQGYTQQEPQFYCGYSCTKHHAKTIKNFLHVYMGFVLVETTCLVHFKFSCKQIMKPNFKNQVESVASENLAVGSLSVETYGVSIEDKISLGVRLMIDQVVSVDTTLQTYTIVAGIGLEWEATNEDIENEEKDGTNWRPQDSYGVNWLNNTNYEILGEEYSLRSGLNEYSNKKYVYHETIFRGTFTNRFDCSSYPFDSQSLVFVCVGINLLKGYFVPIRCRQDIFSVNTTYLAVDDWNFVSYDSDIVNVDWGLSKTGIASDCLKNPELFYSTTAFVIGIKRKWFAQIIRIFVWMFLLSVMIFLMSSIDPTNVEDRLNYSIGILFAIIAFQFVISSHLPNLPYLTIIDKYNVFSLVLILITSIEAYIVGYYDPFFNDITTFDQVFFSIVFVVFILFHALFAWYIKKKIDIQEGIGMTHKYKITDTPLQLNSVLSFESVRKQRKDIDFANKF